MAKANGRRKNKKQKKRKQRKKKKSKTINVNKVVEEYKIQDNKEKAVRLKKKTKKLVLK